MKPSTRATTTIATKMVRSAVAREDDLVAGAATVLVDGWAGSPTRPHSSLSPLSTVVPIVWAAAGAMAATPAVGVPNDAVVGSAGSAVVSANSTVGGGAGDWSSAGPAAFTSGGAAGTSGDAMIAAAAAAVEAPAPGSSATTGSTASATGATVVGSSTT